MCQETKSSESTKKSTVAKRRKLNDTADPGDDSELSDDDVEFTKALTTPKRVPQSSPATLQVSSPIYTIYKDRRVDLAVKTGSIADDLVHDIVRGTVSNMLSVSLRDPFKRLPTTIELREMAKSLVVAYPMLNDPVSGHVSKPYSSSIEPFQKVVPVIIYI